MPSSKITDVLSMLSTWETQAKELAREEVLSESKAQLESLSKKLFESLAFGGDEEAEEINPTEDGGAGTPPQEGVDTATGDVSAEDALADIVDEPLPTASGTTLPAGDEFSWDGANGDPNTPGVSVAKDGNDDTIITIDTTAAGAADNATGECQCDAQHGTPTGPELPIGAETDNEVIDMTKEPNMDEILESFIKLSEDAVNNEVEMVSESENELEETAGVKTAEKLDTNPAMKKITEGENLEQELTEQEMKELDENLDTDALMEALQEAFMSDSGTSGGGSDFGGGSEGGFDDDDIDNDDEFEAAFKSGTKMDTGIDELDEAAGVKSFEKLEGTKPMTKGGEAIKKSGAAPIAEADDADADVDDLLDEETEEVDGDELDESNARTKANGRNQTLKPSGFPKNKLRAGAGGGATSINEAKNLIALAQKQIKDVLKENARLKNTNKELSVLNEGLETKFGEANGKLNEVKGKLYEASIVASKSTCINRLFLEHTTTQDEKIAIVEGFSKASTREEVRNLFGKFDKSFKNGGVNTLNEGKKGISNINPLFITEQPGKDSLNESNVYQNAFTEKMMRMVDYKGKR